MVFKKKRHSDGHWVLTGEIVSGAREAVFFTQLDWVQEQCKTKLGFKPYPGTLNLKINREQWSVVEALRDEEGIMLVPPDPKFCIGRTLPLTVGGIRGALIIPSEDVNIHGKNVLEVMAPVRLKEGLGVDDGDSVTLDVERPISSERRK
jgi:CTP-dependent riboflavin kinase